MRKENYIKNYGNQHCTMAENIKKTMWLSTQDAF